MSRIELNDASIAQRKLTCPGLCDIAPGMARYIDRKCPECRDYFGVVVNQPPDRNYEHRIDGYCAVCGHRLKGWRVILGGKRPGRNSLRQNAQGVPLMERYFARQSTQVATWLR